MRIAVKCSGLVEGKLPPGADGAGAEIEVAQGATIATVMADLGLSVAEGYLVTVDDQVVVPSDISKRYLNEGERLVILPPLRGG